MIEINDKKDCVGCNACSLRCPVGCITMRRDRQGFLYPEVDLEKCIGCNMCEKVCPVINQADPPESIKIFAAKNADETIVGQSSSGGVFSALARKTIEEGGVVGGARFNSNWAVVHDFAETPSGIEPFRTSKYLQSDIGDSFLRVEKLLAEGRKVLFSGTPCQIAALRLFLGKDYGERLLTVDFVCHGVPSPTLWTNYLTGLLNRRAKETGSALKLADISNISFRDKRRGWMDFGLSINLKASAAPTANAPQQSELLFQPFRENIFMEGFLSNLTIRPSCFKCPAKCSKSHSDITLGDFWGIHREYPDLFEKGMFSLVIANNARAVNLLNDLRIQLAEVDPQKTLARNQSYYRSVNQPRPYDRFWTLYETDGIAAIESTIASMRPSAFSRLISRSKRVVRKILRILKTPFRR